ncbi:helicase-exonuclease AddAB subunit AddA [Brotaphodocola sp.]|uniref:helicase-exonuclease AddAB subunit AddA n=1 Tax=Brotaphodocola sp. TaxID=3073577 RepID=UPI003D7C8307
MSDRSERAERSEQLEQAEKPAAEASSVNSVKWTRQQSQVIESRGKNLLVSAAAGSGKTAVLVERIIRLVTEGENPLDIDRLLVMTFTKAAAAEMRERIGMAIEQRLSANPDDAHLQMQSALIHHAQITTIDSFCLSVIREHFNLLDLDPAFRIGDEGEILLLRQDVMAELIEDRYANGGPEFERFVETYAQGKSDAGIEDYITQVHTFSQSNPDPKRWLDQCRRELDQYLEDDRQEEENPRMERENSPGWLTFLLEDARHQAQELVVQMTDALSICREDEFLDAYSPMFQSDIYQLKQIVSARDFDELYEVLSQIAWDRLATVRSKDVDPELKAYVSGCRDRMKKAVGKIKDLCCFATPSEMWKDMEATRDTVRTLLDLAEEFEERFQAKKRERALVDFNDLEHQALKVLIRFEEDGTMTFTDAADELSEQFEAVLVDEYQDSNLVQEALLKAVSGERFGRHNVFLVGDVKQSIYRFRLARPELFLEKYDSYEPYEEGEGNDKKIELHQNFRSRKEVLDAVNDVFYRIMTRNLGNIRYTEESALHAGAQFAPLPERKKRADGEREEQIQRNPLIPELILADTGDAALSQMEEDAADYTAREIEARMIVQKIRELTDPESGVMIWDKALGEYRRASRRDIVILLRSTTGWSEVLTSVLMNEGIPAYAESRTGYFNTLEVETILSLLSVIDNPMQDIPLASVLRSPMCGMNDSELAQMMAGYQKTAKKGQDRGIYAALRFWMNKTQMQNGEKTPVQSSNITNTTRAGKLPPWISKLEKFAGLLEELRMKSIYMPIHELIYEIYEKTGYERYVSAMPAGATRRANLEMLVEKAASYERTSYKGLFHFVRYVENLKKYNTDFGEASTLGEEDDTVRIMSIHKSKGLEFPIVILAGMGKKFNRQDVYGRILIDPELGIGTDYVDPEQRLKNVTLKKNVLKRKMELDSLGEELRVLYVAMTRAKEYLIMTGTDRSLEKTRVKYQRVPLADGQIPYTILASAGSYLDWILMACGSENVRIRIVEKRIPDLVGEELSRQIATKKQRTFLEKLDREKVYDPECSEMLNQTLGKKYPYEADVTLHTKMSVSELKRQGQLTDDEESVCVERILGMNWEAWEMQEEKEEQQENQENSEILGMQKEQERPGVLSSEQSRSYGKTRGAERGTAYHRFFQLLNFSKVTCRQDIKVQRKKFVEEGRLSASANSYIRESLVWNFLQSDLGKRMSLAQSQGRLHKEQQFVVGIPARNMGAGDSDELVIVEGIMDAWFEDDGELVLMDYKTDYVEEEETLRSHYSSQLDYYARALSQMTGKKVREKLIYSLTLGREILIP